MRKALAWVALGLCALLAACLSHRMTGAEVMRRAQQAVQKVSPCHAVLDLEIDTDLIKDTLVVELWEAPPERLKLVVLQAQSAPFRRLAFASDGVQSTSYSPHTGKLTTGSRDLVRLPAVLEPVVLARRAWIAAADADQARVVSVERERGLVLYQVEVPSVRSDGVRFWLDARNWLVRRVAYDDDYLGEGTLWVRELQQFASLPDAAFELNVPEGVDVIVQPSEDARFSSYREAQAAANYPLRQPSYLPPDTRLDYGYQVDQEIVLVYDGAHPFTLRQGPIAGEDAELDGTEVRVGAYRAVLAQDETSGRLLLEWRDGDLQFSIVGASSREEMVRIGASLR